MIGMQKIGLVCDLYTSSGTQQNFIRICSQRSYYGGRTDSLILDILMPSYNCEGQASIPVRTQETAVAVRVQYFCDGPGDCSGSQGPVFL